MLIAVASKSGTDIDQHFGKAEQFLIYDYGSDNSELLKTVEVEKYCNADPSHAQHETRFGAIINALEGCEVVLTEMVGDLPKRELLKAGIMPLTMTGPINDALKQVHDAVCSSKCNERNRV